MIKKAFASLLLVFAAIAFGAWLPRSPAVAPFTPSLRTVQNVNFIDTTYDYQFIDHVRVGGELGGVGPGLAPLTGSYASPSYYFTLGNPTWSTDPTGANLDAAGYAQNFAQLNANSVSYGNHYLLPASADYGAVVGHGYVLKWSGDCRLTHSPGTWTVQSHRIADPNYVLNGNGDWTGTDERIVMTYTGATANQQIGWRIIQGGQFGNGYCHGVHFYREDDEADFLAGKMFRTGYKNILLAQDPSAIRLMNWLGPNNSMVSRFENRAPAAAALSGGSYWTISPPYGQTGGTGNDFTLAAVTGTPASMVHGEVATARLDHSMVNSSLAGYTISAIAKCQGGVNCAAGAQVTTSAAHPFIVGDKVIFRTSFNTGMTQINYYNSTVIAVHSNTEFETSIDTTAFTTFTSGFVVPYVSLQVGSGNDRTPYPVMDTQAANPISNLGSVNFFRANDVRTFYFDKTVFGSRDGSGNLVPGVWMTQNASSGGSNPQEIPVVSDVPIEVGATLVKELNDMSPTHRIDMYMVMPSRALLSMDPDYSGGSSYSYNYVNAALAVLNTTTALTKPNLFLELSPNETWNGPSATFTQYQYLIQRAYLRNGIFGIISANNYMTALRATVAQNDIIAASGTNSQVHFVLGGQGAAGLSTNPVSGTVNDSRFYGNSMYYNDSVISALPKVSKTGSTHSNTVLDGLGSTSDLLVGMGITKADVPAGTQVRSITNSTSIVMTASASGTSTGAAGFTQPPYSYIWGFAWGSYFDPPTNHTAGTFNGVIAGTTLTVSSAAASPTLSVGDFIVGAGVSTNPNTVITGTATVNSGACTPACTGAGNNGTYAVSTSQSISLEAMTKNQYMGYATGTATFTDDSAMYNGTDNSGAVSMTGGTGGANIVTLTITAVASGTPVVNQLLTGTGIPAATTIRAVTGVSPNYTITLSQAATVANGTTISSPSNGGGNYIGVANQAAAITHLNSQLATSTGDSQSVPFYTGLATTYASILAPLGIYSMQYEGGYEINAAINASYGGHIISPADQALILAWQGSADWSTTLQTFFTAYRANSMTVMPASLYLMLSCQWGYASVNCIGDTTLTTVGPDTYSGSVEGGSLNRTWTDNAAVNQTLN